MPFRKKGPDEDDLLIMIRGDGNILFDPKVRQDLGLLHSDSLDMSLTRVEQVPLWHWPRRDDWPVKKGAAFVYAADPPPPQHVSEVMNKILPECYRAALSGNSYRQRRRQRTMNILRTLGGTVVIMAFVMAFVVLPAIHATKAAPVVPSTGAVETTR